MRKGNVFSLSVHREEAGVHDPATRCQFRLGVGWEIQILPQDVTSDGGGVYPLFMKVPPQKNWGGDFFRRGCGRHTSSGHAGRLSCLFFNWKCHLG